MAAMRRHWRLPSGRWHWAQATQRRTRPSSLVLTLSGHHADAIAAIERAMRLNPSLPTSDRIVAGMAFLLNDEPERAIEHT